MEPAPLRRIQRSERRRFAVRSRYSLRQLLRNHHAAGIRIEFAAQMTHLPHCRIGRARHVLQHRVVSGGRIRSLVRRGWCNVSRSGGDGDPGGRHR